MKNAPADEPVRELDDDLTPEREPDDSPTGEMEPPIVAGVGSSALGSVDVEPQKERHPDNDGETVEE
jgi:hypothetical protein